MRGPDHGGSSQHLSTQAIEALNTAYDKISGSGGAVSAQPMSPEHDLVIHSSSQGGGIEIIEKSGSR